MDTISKYKNIFKWVSFSILLIVVTTTLISLGWQGLYSQTKITDKIYSINCFLCIISIVSACLYGAGLYALKSDNTYVSYSKTKKKNKVPEVKKSEKIKQILKKAWPCVLLIVFMLWTSVGCIQASMEAAAEAAIVKQEKEINELEKEILSSNKKEQLERELKTLKSNYEKNKEIANWTTGNRMKNAADRSWNGCDNLKDGYFSFLFYAMVVVNVLMLGKESDNLKKNILRVLMGVAIILVLFSFLSIFEPTFMGGMVKYNRAIFNNSNHYGYFLCISTILCATMAIKDKNLYFRLIAFLGFALNAFMLIINNTFGAYLGVLVALSFTIILIVVNFVKELIKNKMIQIENGLELVRLVILGSIFAFFSCIIISANVSYGITDGNLQITKRVITKIGEYNIKITQENNNVNIRTSSFKNSGDNRVYTINNKELAIVKNVTDYKENTEYYELYNKLYEIKDDKTEMVTKTSNEYSSKTIVERNFEQLFKDMEAIRNHFKNESEENNTILNAENNNLSNNNEMTSGAKENENELSEEVSSAGSGRGEVWLTSFELIKQRPIFGWGLENLLNEFYYQYGVNEGRTHNLILQLAGTTGIPGVIFYMVAVIAIFFKVFSRYKNWGIIEFVCMPIFVGYMVSSMFGNSAFYTSPYFMIILGMLIATTLYKTKSQEIE